MYAHSETAAYIGHVAVLIHRREEPVAVDDQARPDGRIALLREASDVRPAHVRRIDEDGREEERVGAPVLAVDHLQLAVVLVHRDKFRHLRAQEVNEIEK